MKQKIHSLLLIEDSSGDARLICEMLKEAECLCFAVRCVASLDAGIKELKSTAYEAVILDLNLPDSQGLDTFLRLHEECPHLPVVILTGLQDSEVALRAVGAGAQDYLTKGDFSKTILVRVLRYGIERKQLEDQLLQAQKMEAVGRLAGGVAHDFNNIVGIILGYADLALENLDSQNPLSKHLSSIKKAAERAAGLTRQLLAFSRKQVMQPVVLDLNQVVAEVSRMLDRVIGENIQLTLRPSADLGTVRADPMQIEQVLMNLAVNAHDAMPRGGKLIITTSNAELDSEYARHHTSVVPGDYVMLSVSDTGVGMSKDVQAHIFEPFFTTKQPGTGTGLGLAIIYGIVKQSGGHIWAYSEPGIGTNFKIYLPRVNERVPAGASHARKGQEPLPSKKPSETILIAEDEPSLAEMACEVLRTAGYTVLEAASAEEALLVFSSYPDPIHVLLTDVILRTATDGMVLAERLRALRPDLRVIFTSGYSDVLVAAGLPTIGAVFLEKPFTANDLRNKVRETLDRPAASAFASQAQSTET